MPLIANFVVLFLSISRISWLICSLSIAKFVVLVLLIANFVVLLDFEFRRPPQDPPPLSLTPSPSLPASSRGLPSRAHHHRTTPRDSSWRSAPRWSSPRSPAATVERTRSDTLESDRTRLTRAAAFAAAEFAVLGAALGTAAATRGSSLSLSLSLSLCPRLPEPWGGWARDARTRRRRRASAHATGARWGSSRRLRR